MASTALAAALEEASLLIGRLDSRVSASPLAEAWHVRAAILAAVSMAEVDGQPTDEGHILGLLTGSPLPDPSAYGPAKVGLLHWRRCLARVELSDLAERLVGRKVTKHVLALESQEDWDSEDHVSAKALRVITKAPPLPKIDEAAENEAAAALAVLRSVEPSGSKLLGLASALHVAISAGRDHDRAGRMWDLKRTIERQIDDDVERKIAALPSPTEDDEKRLRDNGRQVKEAIDWDSPDRFGAVFGVVADRLQDLGFTQSRLTCLTGSTKRLTMEGRIDDRAQLRFIRKLSVEARSGLALLDGIEALFAEFVRHPEVISDARSALPDIVYGYLVLPAVDAKWIELSLDLNERVARRFVKRLADAGLIKTWGVRRHIPSDGSRARESTLYSATSFQDKYDRALRKRGVNSGRAAGLAITPDEMIGRARDDAVREPMSVVFQRFEEQMIDIDREFGRFWAKKDPKTGPRRGALQRQKG